MGRCRGALAVTTAIALAAGPAAETASAATYVGKVRGSEAFVPSHAGQGAPHRAFLRSRQAAEPDTRRRLDPPAGRFAARCRVERGHAVTGFTAAGKGPAPEADRDEDPAHGRPDAAAGGDRARAAGRDQHHRDPDRAARARRAGLILLSTGPSATCPPTATRPSARPSPR